MHKNVNKTWTTELDTALETLTEVVSVDNIMKKPLVEQKMNFREAAA